MNWEAQLAISMQPEGESVVPQALQARNLCRQKAYGKALEVLWGMLRAARQDGSPQREAFVLIHIGKVYRNWIWDVALKFFTDGLAVAQRCGFTRGEMIAHNAIGELYYAWGDYDRALTHYRLSLGLADTISDLAGKRDILLDMVECYGERGEFDTCDQLLDEAMRLDAVNGVGSLAPDRSKIKVV